MNALFPDVLVIGLGPSGAKAAEVAARSGCRVLAIDRKHQAGDPVQCAEFVPALMGRDVGQWNCAIRQPIKSMVTFVEEEEPDLTENFPGHIIERRQFDQALVDAAIAAGATCRFGVHARTVSDDGNVALSDGSYISPKLIVGADGPRSAVGRAIGQVNRELVETRQVTVPLIAEHFATDIFLSADLPGGYAWLFPKGQLANLGVGVAPAWKSALKESLSRVHQRLVAEGRVGAEVLGYTGGPIPVGGMLDVAGELGAVPVLLAGDAAGLTNPVTGAGINAALISGELAGGAAADWLSGEKKALSEFKDEISELFGPTLERALIRRREALASHGAGARPSPAALRRGWIAYADYWA